MINAWQVYLVMQLDAIRTLFFITGIIGIVGNIFWFGIVLSEEFGDLKFLKRYAIIPVLLLILASIVPSSKTAAAIILLPKLTSKEVLEPLSIETKELYNLAKEALKGMAGENKHEVSK